MEVPAPPAIPGPLHLLPSRAVSWPGLWAGFCEPVPAASHPCSLCPRQISAADSRTDSSRMCPRSWECSLPSAQVPTPSCSPPASLGPLHGVKTCSRECGLVMGNVSCSPGVGLEPCGMKRPLVFVQPKLSTRAPGELWHGRGWGLQAWGFVMGVVAGGRAWASSASADHGPTDSCTCGHAGFREPRDPGVTVHSHISPGPGPSILIRG